MEFTRDAVIITTIATAFIIGVFWMIKLFFRKVLPNLKYDLKYKLFKRKYKIDEVELLTIFLDQDQTEDKVYRTLLCNNIGIKKSKELRYIYKKLKGGN